MDGNFKMSKDRLVELKSNLIEAEKAPDQNKFYIEDLKLSIKRLEKSKDKGYEMVKG